jgi:isopentenyl-diphosphate delta-isomerase
MAKISENSSRKSKQLQVAMSGRQPDAGISTGLERYRFIHQALPEINFHSINLETRVFGRKLLAPLMISPLVGGTPRAAALNRRLAAAAQEFGIGMGLGSERCAIETRPASKSYYVRDVAPDILLLANLGAVQLNYGYGTNECYEAIELAGADGLVLHLNPLQEALQQNGNTNFSGLLEKIRAVCRDLSRPVVVKEVGWGIAGDTARQLVEAGVSGIDVAGAGGTSWSYIEGKCNPDRAVSGAAEGFAGWGIPTAESIVMVKNAVPGVLLIASGGIRSGLDAARAIALGADLAGIGLPLLRAAGQSAQALNSYIGEVILGLKLAMFATGAADIAALKNSRRLEKAS